jgi:arylsulfatase A-like enzyme
MWIGDELLIGLSRAGATWAQWAQGAAAAAYVSMTTATVGGALLGSTLAPLIRPATARWSATWTALRHGDAEVRHTFLARLLASSLLLAAWAEVTYHAVIAVLFGFARPETVAVAMTLANLMLVACLAIGWQLTLGVSQRIVRWASGVRWLGGVVNQAWPLPTAVALAWLSAAAVVAARRRADLAQLPGRDVVPVLGLFMGATLAGLLPRASVRLQRACLLLTGLLFGYGMLVGLRLRPESSRVQSLAFDRALSGRAGYAAWTFALDFDRDGQLSVLGGGDCAPFDARRYTGAPDLPGNGIDEDCDGNDQSQQILQARRAPIVPPRGAGTPAPTVVLVTVDALAAPELLAVGGQRSIMPRVDELTKRAMLFAHCFSQGPSTRMSFPSIFTSRWDSQQTFEYSPRLPYSTSESERTLQEAFDDAGYATAAVLPNVYFDRSRWQSLTKGFQQVDTSAFGSHAGKHNAVEVTDAALRILAEPRDRPLYLWVHYFDAHPPYGAPPGITPPDRDDRTLYEEELSFIDQQVGRLFDTVYARTEPTYLVFTADHATSFHPVPEARHFHYGYDIYTSTLHVPLVVYGPKIRNGRVDEPVSTMDIAPTLANLLGLPNWSRFEGTSLVPELLNGVTDPTRMTFHEYYLPENEFRGNGEPLEFVSVRTNQYDLVLNRKHGTYELYEWNGDYYEQQDLYEERAQRPEVSRLRSALGTFIRRNTRSPSSSSATGVASTHGSRFFDTSRAIEP